VGEWRSGGVEEWGSGGVGEWGRLWMRDGYTQDCNAITYLNLSPSPHLPISPSPRLPISPSPHLPVSPSACPPTRLTLEAQHVFQHPHAALPGNRHAPEERVDDCTEQQWRVALRNQRDVAEIGQEPVPW